MLNEVVGELKATAVLQFVLSHENLILVGAPPEYVRVMEGVALAVYPPVSVITIDVSEDVV
jgi:hypothetical protein